MESDLKVLVEDLEDHLDDLTEAIDPLLTIPLSESASKLPIVDKAKLHVLHVYALESLLFCKALLYPVFSFVRWRILMRFCAAAYLRLNGIKAKDHPIMRELARVKQYIAKIKDAEDNAARQNGAGLHLDKEAAGRFIKHALVRMSRSRTYTYM